MRIERAVRDILLDIGGGPGKEPPAGAYASVFSAP
jgi:hypothetical protein